MQPKLGGELVDVDKLKRIVEENGGYEYITEVRIHAYICVYVYV